ncbi:P-loop NTPase fold protein [Granulicatella sp. 20925_1_28]|uniref:KAP family P-loop NTPase fold protein n=1 Tax=Granulicatella sp. 20925_1_28 TaxID=3003686 RepID=UPI00352E33D8
MQFNTDKPIQNSTEDLLGRKSFSKNLAEAVDKYKGTDSIVIGLFGKWGIGKTSIINMILENLNDKIIVHFSPWNYSSHSDLINLFFIELGQSILDSRNAQDKKSLKKAFFKYKRSIKDISNKPIVKGIISALLQKLLGVYLEFLWSPPSLEETREELKKELGKINNKIIVVIDDIDRLTHKQIRDIFQLVKQVANFPNIVYLLSMDRDIVCDALNHEPQINGHEYLDKIIQIPMEVPKLRKIKLENVLFGKLDSVLESYSEDIIIHKEYWRRVFENCVEPYIGTLRDVNKIINIFQFRFGYLHEETCFEDMLAITILEVLEPKLYRWVGSHKDELCEIGKKGFVTNDGKHIEPRDMYTKEFNELGINSEKAILALSTLFPVFARSVKENRYDDNATDIRKNMRMANIERFDLYFIFDLDDIKVSRTIVSAFAYSFSKKEMEETLTYINDVGEIYYLLEELHSLVDSIPKERLKVMAKTLLSFQGNYSGRKESWLMPIAAKDKANYLAEAILKRIENENERFEVIQYAVNNVEAKGLGQLGVLINTIELAYGRLAGENEKKEDQIISLEHLLEIEKIFLDRIQNVAEEGDFLEIIDMRIACYLWKSFDENSFREFISEKLTDKIYKLKFLCTLAGEWNGTRGKGWGYSLKEFSEYISDENVYNLIKGLNKTELNSFSKIEKIKLASFVLNYEAKDEYHANIEAAEALVKEWEEKD